MLAAGEMSGQGQENLAYEDEEIEITEFDEVTSVSQTKATGKTLELSGQNERDKGMFKDAASEHDSPVIKQATTFHPLPKRDNESDEPDDEIYSDSDIDEYIYNDYLPEEAPPSPETIDGLGYYFDEDGRLKEKGTNEEYKLIKNVNDRKGNQDEYEKLRQAVITYVYELLEKEGLQRVTIPAEPKNNEATGFFFISEGALQKETVLLIIHGSAKIRAGQWSCKVIATGGLEPGTQLDYVRFGLQQNFGVIVLNPNQNFIPEFGAYRPEVIDGSETTLDHILYVWDTFLKESPIQHIAVAAHAYGGLLVSFLMEERPESKEKIFAVAFLDSCHSLHAFGNDVKEKLKECSINWIRSELPLDEEITNSCGEVQRSAGHIGHDWVPHSAKESAFAFIMEKYSDIPQHL